MHVSQHGFQGEQVTMGIGENGDAHQHGLHQGQSTVIPGRTGEDYRCQGW